MHYIFLKNSEWNTPVTVDYDRKYLIIAILFKFVANKNLGVLPISEMLL